MRSAIALFRRQDGRPVALAPRPSLVPRAQGILAVGQLGAADRERELGAMSALSTLYSIVNRTSTAVAKVNWRLYERSRTGNDEDRIEIVDPRNPVVRLLRRPNPFTSWAPFAEGTQQHVDLTGEGWWVALRAGGDKGPPVELWYVRPDRMRPVPHPEDYLSGYVYRSPDGEQVPLPVGNVVQLKMPNPLDPYRGLSPVPSSLAVMGNLQAAIQWNAAFFGNSAEPGGIIEVDTRLGDEEFEELITRWREQHQGVGQAHRVAVLERGHFVERKITQRDMEFVEGLQLSREMIREAYGMPKFLLGGDEGAINRATAEAALVMMGQFLTVPRVDRFKDAWNTGILPMFGPDVPERYEIDYDSPVPGDGAAENASLTARVNAAKTLIDAGADPVEVCEYLDLPPFTFSEPKPPPAPPTPPGAPPTDPGAGDGEDAESPEDPGEPLSVEDFLTVERPWAWLVNAADPDQRVDLEATRQAWDNAFARLGDRWQQVVDGQTRALLAAVRDALDAGDLAQLATFGMPEDLIGTHVLEDAMTGLSSTAAGLVVAEARAQGVTTAAGAPDHGLLRGMAATAAAVLSRSLILGGLREALRVARPGADPRDLTNVVRSAVTATPAGGALPVLAGLLSRAQAEGRYATMAAAPMAKYYATERYDKNTCDPCRKIDGTELPTLDAAMTAYGSGPYLYCEGRWRCRGTYVAVWGNAS